MHGPQGFGYLPLLWLSLFFMIGVWLASFLGFSNAAWLLLAGLCGILLALPRGFRWAAANRPALLRFFLNNLPQSILNRAMKPLIEPAQTGRPQPVTAVLLCLIALSAGGVRYQSARLEITPSHLAWYNDLENPVEIQGMLYRPPEVRDSYVQVLINVEQIIPQGGTAHPVEGKMLARLPAGGEWHYGDRIRLWGVLETPPEDEDFSYKDYLARQKIYSYMPYAAGSLLEGGSGNRVLVWVYGLKERGTALIYRYLPDPEASLLAGIVLGVESGIPNKVEQDFQDTGTTHVIAISGFKIPATRFA